MQQVTSHQPKIMITTISCRLYEPRDIAACSQQVNRKNSTPFRFHSSKFVEVFKENIVQMKDFLRSYNI